MNHRFYAILCFLLLTALAATAQQPPSTKKFRDCINHWKMLRNDCQYPRWDENDYIEIADNLIAYQNPDGGWMKNIDWLSKLNPDSVIGSLKPRHRKSTLDNNNIVPQIEYLAEAYQLTENDKYRQASLRGIEYILNTQKSNGGWRGWDADAITFNDNVTTNAVRLLRDIVQGDKRFDWIDRSTLSRIASAYHKGIDIILRCQVEQDGIKTVWAQQHDNETLQPVKARTYELPGLTALESSDIVLLLMGIDNPSAEIKKAVTAAIEWLWKNRIEGIRLEKIIIGSDSVTGRPIYDRIVVKDTKARPIWARYYEIDDNTPFFCTRQGTKVSQFSEVNHERRTGYAWYGYQPIKALTEYPDWAERNKIPFAGYHLIR